MGGRGQGRVATTVFKHHQQYLGEGMRGPQRLLSAVLCQCIRAELLGDVAQDQDMCLCIAAALLQVSTLQASKQLQIIEPTQGFPRDSRLGAKERSIESA